jgi:hypothetical protein
MTYPSADGFRRRAPRSSVLVRVLGWRRERDDAGSRAEALIEPRRLVFSDETAEHLAALRAEGFTLTQIAEAAELSVGVVHKCSQPGRSINESTADAVLAVKPR